MLNDLNSEPFRERYGLIRLRGQSDGGISWRGASPQLPRSEAKSAKNLGRSKLMEILREKISFSIRLSNLVNV